MFELNNIYNQDAVLGLKQIQDESIEKTQELELILANGIWILIMILGLKKVSRF